jgi:hypothetical protein
MQLPYHSKIFTCKERPGRDLAPRPAPGYPVDEKVRIWMNHSLCRSLNIAPAPRIEATPTHSPLVTLPPTSRVRAFYGRLQPPELVEKSSFGGAS